MFENKGLNKKFKQQIQKISKSKKTKSQRKMSKT